MSRPSEHPSAEPLLKASPFYDKDRFSLAAATLPYRAADCAPAVGVSSFVAPQSERACLTRGKAGGSMSGEENSRGRKKNGKVGSSRRHQMRSTSPASAGDMANKHAASQKLFLAALALGLSLISFVIQTETAVYIQHDLGWKKAYAMLYLTHGSWIFLWPLTIVFLWIRKRSIPWRSFVRSHMSLVRSTAQMVRYQSKRLSHTQASQNPFFHMVKQIATITCALTVAGSSWYVAVNLTTPSDLTAIYNCSAFFAYAFSIPLLHEKVRSGKVLSVLFAIVGVLIVAYGGGDSKSTGEAGDGGGSVDNKQQQPSTRIIGNLIIGVGSVLYGFYEVLYKKLACPPNNTSPGRSAIFANVVATGMGFFTVFILWIPIPILHYLDIERFELPSGKAAWYMVISAVAGLVFSGSFLILISLTSPVLSSVAALLTIFLVAVTDFVLTGQPLTAASVFGGVVIIVAFGMLAWDSWMELKEGSEGVIAEGEDEDEDEGEDGPDGLDGEGGESGEETDVEVGRRAARVKGRRGESSDDENDEDEEGGKSGVERRLL